MVKSSNGYYKEEIAQMLRYDMIFEEIPVGNSTFLQKIRAAAAPHTNFAPGKINFAIIKKGGKYDNLPEVPFKY